MIVQLSLIREHGNFDSDDISDTLLTQYYDAGWQEYAPHLTLFHSGHMAVEQLREKGQLIQDQFLPFTGYITEIDYSLLTGDNQFEIIDRVLLKS